MTKNIDVGLLILRISIGGLMLLHGIAKLVYGVAPIEGMLQEKGLPGFIAYGVIVGEVIAPLAILWGFRARLASLILGFNCIVAIALVHSSDLLSLNQVGGWSVELLGLFLFGAVALFFTGSGELAVSRTSKWD